MDAWELTKQDPAAGSIREAAARGALTHALLLTGSGQLEQLAQYAAAALECEGDGALHPCGTCAGCRKVRQGIHPDVTLVRDEEHRSIAVDVIRAIRADAWIRPNEGARKVYVFPDCSLLTEQDQNVLLKTVEEGPPYAAFVFCAENASAVLPTLRSRCVELKLRPTGEGAALSEQTGALCRSLCAGKKGAPAEMLCRLEQKKPSREELERLLEETRAVFAAAMAVRCGVPAEKSMQKEASAVAQTLTNGQMMRTIELLEKYRRDCAYYVNVGQELGALAVELEGIF